MQPHLVGPRGGFSRVFHLGQKKVQIIRSNANILYMKCIMRRLISKNLEKLDFMGHANASRWGLQGDENIGAYHITSVFMI